MSVVNNLSQSKLKERFNAKEFSPLSSDAVAFGRVSTDDQKKHGHSDAAQMERIQEYAKRKRLNILKQWDVSETGFKHEKRKAFNEMMAFVKANKSVCHVIFSHQSRSNRNWKSAQQLGNMIRSGRIVLHCVRDALVLHKHSPFEDWIRWEIFNHVNQKQSEDHRNNVWDGITKVIELEGRRPGGKTNTGYKIVYDKDGEPYWELDPPLSDYMRMAFELFSTGMYAPNKWTKLTEDLESFFPNLPNKPKPQNLGKMIDNPVYCSEFIYCGEVWIGNQPALISKVLFDKCQSFRGADTNGRFQKATHDFAFRQLIKCGGKILNSDGKETDEDCGCMYTAEETRKKNSDGTTRKTYLYYHCGRTKRKCSNKSAKFMRSIGQPANLSEQELETLFWNKIVKPLVVPKKRAEWMVASIMHFHEARKQISKQAYGAATRRLQMIAQAQQLLLDKYSEGKIAEDFWLEQTERYRLERKSLESRIATYGEESDKHLDVSRKLIELCQNLDLAWEKATSREKREIVESVASNLTLKNGTLEFSWKKPYCWLAEKPSRTKWWR